MVREEMPGELARLCVVIAALMQPESESRRVLSV